MNLLKAMNDAGWSPSETILDQLSDYDKSFALIEFTGLRSLSYYRTRLKALGFSHLRNVLDAACGMGQWSLAMTDLNDAVFGIDMDEGRIGFGRDLAASMGRRSCEFQKGHLEALPYKKQTMDAVFCYGALMFTEIPLALAEFSRVLKPNGKLYVNANSLGWYLHMFLDRGLISRKWTPMKWALLMAMNTIRGKTSQIIVTRRALRNYLRTAGFKVEAIGLEGTLCIGSSTPLFEPAYRSRFYGIGSIIEAVATKE